MRARLAADVGRLSWRPLVSVITPVHNTPPEWLTACIDSVRAQIYPDWELCLADDASTSAETRRVLEAAAGADSRIKVVRLHENRQVSGASNAALALATGEFIALLDHDDDLEPDALLEVVRFLNRHSECDFVYTDEDKRDAAGARCDPYFKPDWSPEQFLCFPYTNHLMVLRRSVVEAVGGFREGFEGSQDYDLALRVVERSDRVGHVPKVLYHWRQAPRSAAVDSAAKPWAIEAARRAIVDHLARTGNDADVLDGARPGFFRVKHRLRARPLVSIVMPTADGRRTVRGREVRLAAQALRSIRSSTTYSDYEVVLVEHAALNPLSGETLDALAAVPHRRVPYGDTGPFSFSRAVNLGAAAAAGDQIVLFNDDLEVITPDWIEALLEYAQADRIGAVGPKLLLPDGRLQHIGIVLGVCGTAAHAFHQAPGGTPGYFGSALGPRNYSAVTGACLMTRRALFEGMGGFDEGLASDFNDVDYCLRLGRAGYRTVFTPYAELYHHESSSYGRRAWNAAERARVQEKWPEAFEQDPFYNPNLTRDFPDYRLGD
jgi:GT2 family glycosyltransferase